MGTAYVSTPSGPAMTLSASATSRTVRAIGPTCMNLSSTSGQCAVSGTRPCVALSPDDAAVVGRLPDRPADVAADSQRRHARRDGGGLAAAGAARGAPLEPRVLGAPENDVVGLPPQGELGHVRLADDDGPGVGQPLDDRRVGGRHVVGEQPRPPGRPQSGCVDAVLDGDRHAVQRAPQRRPRRAAASASRARSSARPSSVTTALSRPLTSSIRRRCARTTSTGETSPSRTSPASAVASL